MALSDRAAAIGPYAQGLLENNDVRATAHQAAGATRAAYQRARGQDARKAMQDRKLRRRITAAVAAMGELVGAVSKSSPPPKQKSRWPRRIALLALIAGAAWLIEHPAVGARIESVLGREGSDGPADHSRVDQPHETEA